MTNAGLGGFALHYITANHRTLLSAVAASSRLDVSRSDSPSIPTKHPFFSKTHPHTFPPTHFQNKTRLFTKPENPERNHILPFKGRLKFPHRCCRLIFFIYFLFHVREFPPCSFHPPRSAQCDTLHFPPIPPSLSPWSQGESFMWERSGFWKVAGVVSVEAREKGIGCWTWRQMFS